MTLGSPNILHKVSRSSRVHIPLISLSPRDQFHKNIASFIRTTMTDEASFVPTSAPGLKKIAPYWYPYTTMAKLRWLGRELLEVVSTEFRDRSMEYYRYALESGVTTINGRIAKPDTIIENGDRIENVVHRHEPPVTSTPVKVLHHDVEREFIIVDKPGSIPVHASGRYFRNTLVEILVNDFGYTKVYTVNRLDRLTSGLMILPLSAERARELTSEFVAGTVRKEYVARCRGRFPSEEVVCEEPLLTVDRQMGLNIVHPEGKPAKTIFNCIRYDANTDSSVVRCRPLTGRSHQIRVHLQYLGYPIANDPVYSETKIWGDNLGKGGIDVTPSEERAAPSPPPHLKSDVDAIGNPESLTKTAAYGEQPPIVPYVKLLPRETGQDIGMGSPVPLSTEAVGVITRLRNMKDEDEDWSRWRDVVFRAKGVLTPRGLDIKPPHRKTKESVGQGEFVNESWNLKKAPKYYSDEDKASSKKTRRTLKKHAPRFHSREFGSALDRRGSRKTIVEADNRYCPECYLPLHPDPKPEKLYIFLHALKYTTSLGSFETDMPEWAGEGWSWERS
ncbi:tRNA-pseudouridine synthase [Infundibulicybe gibba]|nr:tRNA-pseudouridine synthase [Infundibulicybe gibba]